MIGGEDGETEDPNKSVHHLVFDDKTNQLWYYNSKSDQAPGCAESNSTNPNQQPSLLLGVKGLKEFATGILSSKDDKKINIVAAGGKINGTVFRQLLLLRDFSQKNSSKSTPERYSFPLARHSASSVVVPTAFFAGMNCSIKAEEKNSGRELTSGIGTLIFILGLFFL
ncbi:uncharacterized protein LOC111705835 [Eurytemora carolleeae]|uniref:uncharacterized protein LOC111705835 n=1 Tax=Eurytemora carolleeae TaxID=1294199 RepID=UPI000C76102B|nr:uncharacterized protein LOC111705835 [Eurytemora carolleeae]|eukprot:XP_023334282.1 uncharacterized protein LOC111705835 [Eurytemora affinis]